MGVVTQGLSDEKVVAGEMIVRRFEGVSWIIYTQSGRKILIFDVHLSLPDTSFP